MSTGKDRHAANGIFMQSVMILNLRIILPGVKVDQIRW